MYVPTQYLPTQDSIVSKWIRWTENVLNYKNIGIDALSLKLLKNKYYSFFPCFGSKFFLFSLQTNLELG